MHCCGNRLRRQLAQFALDNGADYAINYTTEEIRTREKILFGGADVVYDPVSGNVFDAVTVVLISEGRIIIIGFASGTIADAPANYVLVKTSLSSAFRSVRIDAYRRSSSVPIACLFEMWAAGHLKPQQSHAFPLEETPKAIKALRDRKAKGKVVIKVRDEE